MSPPLRTLLRGRGRRLLVAIAVLLLALAGGYKLFKFPPDTTPEGAYMRIAKAIGGDEPEAAFAYLEEEAQHASFTIGDYACQAVERIRHAYPEPIKSRELARYEALAACREGPEVWARLARDRGFIQRLRRDLSGVQQVTLAGERATVLTARGTRYSFRRRPNGIWGLTLFTVELEGLAEKLARDWERIQRDAGDYQRGAGPSSESRGSG